MFINFRVLPPFSKHQNFVAIRLVVTTILNKNIVRNAHSKNIQISYEPKNCVVQ